MDQAPYDTLLSAAANYAEAVVPALTGEWAPRVVSAAEIRPGHRVLDVACGTGVLAREAAKAATESGYLIGLDPDPGMLTIARRSSKGIAFHRGAAESLPFPEGSFDAVISQFGMMFFPERVRAAREMWRVLKPGGRLVVAVWASLRDTPAYQEQVDLVERLAGPGPAEVLRSPFVLGDEAVFRQIFTDAGVPLTRLRLEPGSAAFPSVRAMLETDLVEWLPATGVILDKAVVERIITEGEQVFARYSTSDGSIHFASPALLAVALKP